MSVAIGNHVAESRAKEIERLRLKRRSVELSHLEAWLGRGRGSFHFENLEFLPHIIRGALRLTGMLARGERNALSPVVRNLVFDFENLPEEFDGFRILHLSDIHADGLFGLAETIADLIRDIEVDLCVLTGDYRFEIHGPCHSVYYNMEKILPAVNSKRGIVGVLGNHDFAEEVPELERMGIKMLINESLELRSGMSSIWLVGLDDPHYYGCDDLPAALSEVPDDAFKLLLVHTPEMLDDAAAADIDLYLCGHTHGGQICLPLIGPVLVNASCPRKYTRGVWNYKGVQGFTSAGIGSSGVAVRFNCPPEVAVLELRKRDAADSR